MESFDSWVKVQESSDSGNNKCVLVQYLCKVEEQIKKLKDTTTLLDGSSDDIERFQRQFQQLEKLRATRYDHVIKTLEQLIMQARARENQSALGSIVESSENLCCQEPKSFISEIQNVNKVTNMNEDSETSQTPLEMDANNQPPQESENSQPPLSQSEDNQPPLSQSENSQPAQESADIQHALAESTEAPANLTEPIPPTHLHNDPMTVEEAGWERRPDIQNFSGRTRSQLNDIFYNTSSSSFSLFKVDSQILSALLYALRNNKTVQYLTLSFTSKYQLSDETVDNLFEVFSNLQ